MRYISVLSWLLVVTYEVDQTSVLHNEKPKDKVTFLS